MAGVDFSTLMTPDEVALARKASETVASYMSGEKLKAKLHDALEIGDVLLGGSYEAMRAVGANQPLGKPYNMAFAKWKREFGFDVTPTGEKVPLAFLADCIVCARHRDIANDIIASLDANQRINVGISGLAKRVRTQVNAIEAATRASEAPPKPAAAPVAPKPAPQAEAVRSAPAPLPDPVQKAADNAEIATLKKELWAARDKLDQLGMFLVDKPPPKAEDRPIPNYRYWPLPETLGRRPKDVAPRQIVEPPADVTGDPAFALRKEEFEQWLVRRK